MTLTPMRFDGYTWPHNPRSLTLESGRRTIEFAPPLRDAGMTLAGERITAVEGTGEWYGGDALSQYAELYALYRRGGVGVLAIPGLEAMHACFVSLTLTAAPSDGVPGYRFRFERAAAPQAEQPTQYTVTSGDGESLWDVSYRLGIGIDQLVELNPQIRYPDAVMINERVRIC